MNLTTGVLLGVVLALIAEAVHSDRLSFLAGLLVGAALALALVASTSSDDT